MKEKDLAYWKKNAEEDYMKAPISVLRYITELEKVANEQNQQSEVDYQKMFANCKLPNEQPTKTVEERALELYSIELNVKGYDENLAKRKAYIKGATDNGNK